MTEYNCLCHLAANDRKSDTGKLFGKDLLSMIKKEKGLVALAEHDDQQQFTMPYNDLLNNTVYDC